MGAAAITSCAPHFGACDLAEVRERLDRGGPEPLETVEVLSLVLALGGVRQADACAAGLLDRFGSVAEVLGQPEPELRRAAGGRVARLVVLVRDLQRRALAEPLRRRPVISSWSALASYLRATLAGRPREETHALFLDRRNGLIRDERLGEGSVCHAPLYPREVVRRALELNAASVILAHNHPAGGAEPSAADRQSTVETDAACRALGLTLHDHVLVARDEVVSLRALGVFP